jgi:hypothetical protein
LAGNFLKIGEGRKAAQRASGLVFKQSHMVAPSGCGEYGVR